MVRIIQASISAATTALLAFWLVMMVRDPITELSRDLLYGIISASAFIWVFGFIFSALLLLPLIYAFVLGSREFSLLLFSLVGFVVPASLQTLFSTIPAHGETPPLYRADNEQVIIGILSIGAVGSISALAAWWSLRRSGRNAPNK